MTTVVLQELLKTLWLGLPEVARDALEINHVCSLLRSLVGVMNEKETPSLSAIEDIVNPFMNCIKKVRELRQRTYAPQRSVEWLNLRKDLLTASNLADALNRGKFSSRTSLVAKKAEERRDKTKGEIVPTLGATPAATPASAPANESFKCFAMKWGTMFEPMISRIYTEMNDDIDLYEFGLIIHPTLKCFGASPDGITSMGKMVEIKCPLKRPIVKGDVPDHYYLQIQGQLAVCELTECDYIEVVMEEFGTLGDYYENVPENERHAHGILLELQTIPPEKSEGAPSAEEWYEYSPPKLSPKEAYEWLRLRIREIAHQRPDINIAKIRYWKMKDYNLVSVPFDAELWTSLVPQIQQFWDDVVAKTNPSNVLEEGAIAPPVKKTRAKREKKTVKFSYRDEDDEPSIIS
jgi:putative phage-type endonuclease